MGPLATLLVPGELGLRVLKGPEFMTSVLDVLAV